MSGADRARAARAVAEFLAALGHPTDSDPELASTPERVAAAWADELLTGYDADLGALLAEGSPTSPAGDGAGGAPGDGAGGAPSDGAGGARGDDLVVVTDIAVATLCPHHLMPALGRAAVAYQPGERWLGLGTLAALVDTLARRLVLQERLARDVVEALLAHGGARGAFCRIELRHGCLSARGERQHGASAVSTAAGGTLSGDAGQTRLSLALALGATASEP